MLLPVDEKATCGDTLAFLEEGLNNDSYKLNYSDCGERFYKVDNKGLRAHSKVKRELNPFTLS